MTWSHCAAVIIVIAERSVFCVLYRLDILKVAESTCSKKNGKGK